MENESTISRPPTGLEKFFNISFRVSAYAFGWLTVIVVLYVIGKISWEAVPAMQEHGLGFITGRTWDANTGEYGILPEIWGTLYSSVLALIIGTLFGVSVAVFLAEGFLSGFVFWVLKFFGLQYHSVLGKLPDALEQLLKNLIELLAAIPSVVYGLWGIFVLIPLIRPACNWLHNQFEWIPFFSTSLPGPGMLPAALVLSVMILPTISAISRDALVAVPPKLREASYGLGATRWETILAVIVPTAGTGIFGAVILAFGRALGETMALAMLVGNSNEMSLSLFSPANTLAALLANNFPEAGEKDLPVLMFAALVLLVITLVVNILGAWVLQRASSGMEVDR
jgi:phosphate transport system permease protein